MDFKQLFYFTQVVKYGGFSPAAKMLYITPQALSKSISQLEKEYNCQLFVRSKNNVLTLSDIGQQLLTEAKPLLEHYFLMDQHIKQLSEIENGKFKVAIAQCTLNIIDINLFKKFKEEFPQLDPQCLELPDLIVDDYIETGKVEVCFNINDLPNQDQYESILLCSSELSAVGRGVNSHNYNNNFITLDDLINKRIVARSELYKSYQILERAAKEQNIELNYALRTSDDTLIVDRIESPEYIGIGVHALHQVLIHIGGKSVPLRPSLPWNIYMSYKKYEPISKPVQLFIKYVKDHYVTGSSQLEDSPEHR